MDSPNEKTGEAGLLSVAEAAAYLKCRPSTIYAKAAKEQLPYVRLWSGRRKAAIRFSMDSLKDHIRRHTITPKPRAGA